MVKGGEETKKRKFSGFNKDISLPNRIIEYIRTKWKRILLVFASIFLVAVLIFAYRVYNAGLEAEASGMVSKIIANYKQNPDDIKPFELIMNKYGGTNGARLAKLYIGHILYRTGKSGKAEIAYGELVEDSDTPVTVRSEAILGQVHSLVNLKKCEKAQATIKKFTRTGNIQEQQGLIAIGRCYELKGNKNLAIEKYQEFAGKYPQSPLLTSSLRSKINKVPKK